MKQKRLGDILYVFDVNPYEITSDTDAEVVKVQEESFAGFIEMNPSLAEKIVKYNYHTMCVNVPEWAPYVEQEDPQETLTFGIYGSAAEVNVSQVVLRRQGGMVTQWTAGDNLFFPFQTECLEDDVFEVHLIEGVDPANLNITGDEYVNWGWVGEDPRTYTGLVTMSSSISIGIESSEPSTYKLYLQGTDINDTNLRVTTNSVQVALEDLVAGIDVAEDTLIEVWLLTEDINDYDVSSISTWMNESTDGGHLHYWRNMLAGDTTINISFIGGVNFNAKWDGAPENVSQINIGNTSVTGNDLTDPNWTETVHLHPGQSQVTFFVSTGLPTDMSTFKVGFRDDQPTWSEYHYAYKQTDPVTGEPFYTDAGDASGSTITNPGTWTYNNTPETGLPYITFTLPSTDANGNAFVDNTEIKINSEVEGS